MLIYFLAHAGEGSGWNWHLPPLHPIFVNFTAALIPASVLSDVLGRWFKRDSFHKAAWWMLLYAAVVTPLTAAAGWWWMRHGMEGMIDWRLPVHMWLGFTMTAIAIVLAIWRGRMHRTERAPGLAYLLAASLAVGALVVQGELGGQMSFGSMDTPTEASHESNRRSRGSMPHDTMSEGSMPHDSTSQPATKPQNPGHEHGTPSGELQWRDQIELNG